MWFSYEPRPCCTVMPLESHDIKDLTESLLSAGLDAAGKTTTLYKLKLGEVVTTIPTIGECSPFNFTINRTFTIPAARILNHTLAGFNVETVTHRNVSFVTWDIGGRDKIVSIRNVNWSRLVHIV